MESVFITARLCPTSRFILRAPIRLRAGYSARMKHGSAANIKEQYTGLRDSASSNIADISIELRHSDAVPRRSRLGISLEPLRRAKKNTLRERGLHERRRYIKYIGISSHAL